MTRTIATSRRDDDRDESPIQTHRQGSSSGSTTARAALPYDSPRHTLSGAGRRAYGDGETTAGLEHAGASMNKHPHNQTEYENRRLRRALPVCTRTDGNCFRLTNSYRNGHIDLLHEAHVSIAAGVTRMMTRGRWWRDGLPSQSWLPRCGPPGAVALSLLVGGIDAKNVLSAPHFIG